MRSLAKAATIATLGFATTISMLPVVALALPVNDRVVTYRDAPNGEIVGAFVMNCHGQTSMEGVQTPYLSVVETSCLVRGEDECASWPAEFGTCPF
jgi:hypothetical protein